MPIIDKAEQKKTLSKITVGEEIYSELFDYLRYLGYDKKREKEGTDKIIDGALKLLFKKEQRNNDYKKFKTELEKERNKNALTSTIDDVNEVE